MLKELEQEYLAFISFIYLVLVFSFIKEKLELNLTDSMVLEMAFICFGLKVQERDFQITMESLKIYVKIIFHSYQMSKELTELAVEKLLIL